MKIIDSLKRYIAEFADAIDQCDGQLEMYACHLHPTIDILTGVTIVKQFNYFWPKKLSDEIW